MCLKANILLDFRLDKPVFPSCLYYIYRFSISINKMLWARRFISGIASSISIIYREPLSFTTSCFHPHPQSFHEYVIRSIASLLFSYPACFVFSDLSSSFPPPYSWRYISLLHSSARIIVPNISCLKCISVFLDFKGNYCFRIWFKNLELSYFLIAFSKCIGDASLFPNDVLHKQPSHASINNIFQHYPK